MTLTHSSVSSISSGASAPPAVWADACLAAAVLAVDPWGVGGIVLRALPGPVRDLWLEWLHELLPAGTPWRRVPLHVAESRLLGGLDLAATLRAGRPIAERGLLAEADGGVLVLAMAERVGRATAAHLCATLDAGAVVLERDGLTARAPARCGVIALDESSDEDEQVPFALTDRLPLWLDLTQVALRDAVPAAYSAEHILAARDLLPQVTLAETEVEALCGTALALGVDSLRPSLAAARVARLVAAIHGRTQITAEDLSAAARLILAPRATRLPVPESPEEPPPPEAPEQQDDSDGEQNDSAQNIDRPLEDRVLEAAQAAIPPHLLAQLQVGTWRGRARTSGKSGAQHHASLRGRPAGTYRGEPGAGARLNVLETLRAAAPWQKIRRAERQRQRGLQEHTRTSRKTRTRREATVHLEVRRDDFRVTRYRQRSETTTIFVVDASGSAALHRLAEAKGAVELLLADCYVRRDRVALIAFRGAGAELLLPPTRSLVRAKRSLAGLPGGGGTPLAAAIDAALDLADGVRRRGGTAVVVLLTDGRANVARDGTGGRAQASADALAAARRFRVAELTALVIDVSPRPRPEAAELAREMGAVYLPLPHADATALSQAVKAVA